MRVFVLVCEIAFFFLSLSFVLSSSLRLMQTMVCWADKCFSYVLEISDIHHQFTNYVKSLIHNENGGEWFKGIRCFEWVIQVDLVISQINRIDQFVSAKSNPQNSNEKIGVVVSVPNKPYPPNSPQPLQRILTKMKIFARITSKRKENTNKKLCVNFESGSEIIVNSSS